LFLLLLRDGGGGGGFSLLLWLQLELHLLLVDRRSVLGLRLVVGCIGEIVQVRGIVDARTEAQTIRGRGPDELGWLVGQVLLRSADAKSLQRLSGPIRIRLVILILVAPLDGLTAAFRAALDASQAPRPIEIGAHLAGPLFAVRHIALPRLVLWLDRIARGRGCGRHHSHFNGGRLLRRAAALLGRTQTARKGC